MLWAAVFAVLCIAASTEAASLHIVWDASNSTAVVGYRVHYGEFPAARDSTAEDLKSKDPTSKDSKHYTKAVRVDGRLTNSAVIEGLEVGKTYFFAVTACNKDGKESAFSLEISHKIGDPLPGQAGGGRSVASGGAGPQAGVAADRKPAAGVLPQPGPAPDHPRRDAPPHGAASSTPRKEEPQAPSQIKVAPSKSVAKTSDGKIGPSVSW